MINYSKILSPELTEKNQTIHLFSLVNIMKLNPGELIITPE